ncbi:MAG: ATP-binding protein [Myxococcales bacterium]|nr:ATP-binding protein [Myxococcota bacterium]MDW8282231.1 ATP-binding protein [Myxococcales bacterium]
MDAPSLPETLSPYFLRQVIEHVGHPIFIKDRSFRFVLVNRACCEMLGLTAEQMIGRTDYDFFPREQADFFRLKDTEMFRTDAKVVIEEEPITDARGQLHVLSTVKVPLHDEQGRLTHLVGIIHDISHLKRVEAELRTANAELAQAQQELRQHAGQLEHQLSLRTAQLRHRNDELMAILANLGEGVLVADATGALVLQNDAAVNLLGGQRPADIDAWSAAAGLRWPDGQWVSPPQLPLRRALQGESVHNAQFRMHAPGGQGDAWVLLSAAPLPEGRGAVCALRDVTALKEAERMKEEFLQVASHELRTPLASLKLMLGAVAAQLRGEQCEALRPLIERGHRLVDRMSRLIGDILDSSRLQLGRLSVELRRVELAALVREAVERAQAASLGEHRFRLELHGPLWVHADGDRLDQVVGNLLANACKYAPAGSTVSVSCARSNGMALVTVRDEGPGIPPELRERIFDRFYQVEARAGRSFGGLGLGLYICRQILAAHGGRIWVESEPGQGSTFRFTLPALAEEG